MPSPRAVARSALRWDAAYCATAGSAAVAFAGPLASHLAVPVWLLALSGFGVIAWAGIVWGMARADGWWGPTALVAGINLAAAVALAVWASATSGPGGAVLGLAAVQVLGFAAVQGAAALRGWADRVG
ncbi:MAG: hypothetical protein KQH83_06190 [Actinobacteria bacterium]|nr:hypothetical protein [Actinomycetota bacterium]